MHTSNTGIKRIYIAGKVTGEDWNDVVSKFAAAEEYIIGCGCESVNPLNIVGDSTDGWKADMRKCIAALMQCDSIYCLPCWPKSRGALLERYLAGHVGIEIIDAKPINV